MEFVLVAPTHVSPHLAEWSMQISRGSPTRQYHHPECHLCQNTVRTRPRHSRPLSSNLRNASTMTVTRFLGSFGITASWGLPYLEACNADAEVMPDP